MSISVNGPEAVRRIQVLRAIESGAIRRLDDACWEVRYRSDPLGWAGCSEDVAADLDTLRADGRLTLDEGGIAFLVPGKREQGTTS
jgi:hypothetical protein